MSAGATQIGSIAVTLVVRNFELNSTSSLRTFLSASVGQMCIAHGDSAGGGCPNATEVHLWNRLYGHLFLDHRVTISLSDHAPTTGQYANDYGAFLSGTEFPSGQRLQGATPTTIVFPWWNPQDTQPTFTTNLSNWKSVLAANNNWPGFSFHYAKFWTFDGSGQVVVLDEPHSNPADWNSPGFIVDQGTWAHALDPNFPVLVTANATNYANATANPPAVNILSPLVDEMDVKIASTLLYQGNHRPDYDPLLNAKMGNQLWMYQSCDSHGCGDNQNPNAINYPNVMVDATAVQNRAEPWMHFIYGNTGGMLYYDVAARLANAWDADGLFLSGGNGDGTLAYPGTPVAVPGGSSVGIGGMTHIPLASIRLKMIREGLEDYEYLLMCNSVNPTTAMNVATSLFTMVANGSNGFAFGSMYHANDVGGSISPAQFAANLEPAREQLANCISGSTCAANCAGCCDGNGSCLPIATESDGACGAGGALCIGCLSGQKCVNGACTTIVCSKSNCGGCCDANNQCHPLGNQNYCGSPGTWLDAEGEEIADKCPYQACLPVGTSVELLQPLFSNQAHGCVTGF